MPLRAMQQTFIFVGNSKMTNGERRIRELLSETQQKYDRQLLYAVVSEQVAKVENLLSRGADVNIVGRYFRSPLHLAVNRNNLSLVDILVQHGADIRAKNESDKTPLDVARDYGGSEIAHTLNEHQRIYDNELLAALEKGDIAKTRSLIGRGADINLRGHLGETPLHLAAYTGKEVDFLLRREAKIEIGDNNGWTPLHWAVWQNQQGAVKSLLLWGANIRAKTNNDQMPLGIAEGYKKLEIAHTLNEHQRIYDNELLAAAQSDDVDGIVNLLSRGANIYAVNELRYTALHLAAKAGNLDAILLLVRRGGDINARSIDGNSPLDLLERNSEVKDEKRKSEVMSFLRGEHPDVELPVVVSRRGGTRDRRSIENANFVVEGNQATSGASKPSSWTGSIVDWIKGSTESPALLTSGERNDHTVTDVPEVNPALVNNTIILGILAAGLFNKTQYRQPIHENLLSPREQSMRLNNIDENMIIRAIQQGEEKFVDPDTKMDEVKISGNKTGM